MRAGSRRELGFSPYWPTMCEIHPSEKSNTARQVLELVVVENGRICDEHFRLRLAGPRAIYAGPGQFVQLRCRRLGEEDGAVDPVLLPRPFSLAGVETTDSGCELEIIYRMVGPGTRWMMGLGPDDRVRALGPLGNRFEIPRDRPTAYVVGGGMGLPPMIWLAERLRAVSCDVVAFCGARTAGLMALSLTRPATTEASRPNLAAEEFARHGTPAVMTTDDGSMGVPGLVSNAMDAYHAANPCPPDELIVYACGPEPMMRVIAQWCANRGVRCRVCMERMMACGIGTCQSCVVAVRDESADGGLVYKLCCSDGPVFDARDIVWD